MRWARSIALVAFGAVGVNALSEDDRVSLVPWKVVAPGDRVDAPLVLYWVPAAADELRRSPLLTSDDLTFFSSRCVAMRVVRVDDSVRRAMLEAETRLPAALLTNDTGATLGMVEAEDGALPVGAVEALVRHELDARVSSANSRLDQAGELARRGERSRAEALYRALWEERCVCPREAKAAQRALRKLGKK